MILKLQLKDILWLFFYTVYSLNIFFLYLVN